MIYKMEYFSRTPFVFHKRPFVYLLLCFILLPAVSTLLHEGGHYMAMRALGHQHLVIHYTFTDTSRNEIRAERHAIHLRNKEAIDNNLQFPEESRYQLLGRQIDTMWATYKVRRFDAREAFMYASGPLENILTGTIGILLLLVYRRSYKRALALNVRQWAIVFSALFWYSAVPTLLGIIYKYFIRGDQDMRTDLYKVSVHFGLYPWALDIVCGVLGVLAVWLILRFIPAGQRCTAALAGFLGILVGSVLWWGLVGPLLMP